MRTKIYSSSVATTLRFLHFWTSWVPLQVLGGAARAGFSAEHSGAAPLGGDWTGPGEKWRHYCLPLTRCTATSSHNTTKVSPTVTVSAQKPLLSSSSAQRPFAEISGALMLGGGASCREGCMEGVGLQTCVGTPDPGDCGPSQTRDGKELGCGGREEHQVPGEPTGPRKRAHQDTRLEVFIMCSCVKGISNLSPNDLA